MSRKQLLMTSEGISHKNILPKFGSNNQPNLRLEHDLRKFMTPASPKEELKEDSGGATVADANANNVTGDGAVGSAAAETAGASGVSDPVLKAVGEQASNLAARASSNEESLITTTVNRLLETMDDYGMHESVVKEFLSDLSEAGIK